MIRQWVFAALLMFAAACSSHEHEVVVIEKTGTYHTEECTKVKMARTETMPLDEARKRNMKPCSLCQPDAKERN